MSDHATIGLLDISVVANKERKGLRGNATRVSRKGVDIRTLAEKQNRLVPYQKLIDPVYLATLLPGIRERAANSECAQLDEKLVKKAAALVPSLSVLQMNVLMLKERGLRKQAFRDEIEISSRGLSTAVITIYERIGIPGLPGDLRRRTAYAAWRAFVEERVKK